MSNQSDQKSQEALLKEMEIDHAYLMSVEQSMFYHFRFLVVLILSEIAAVAAVIKFFFNMGQHEAARVILFVLSVFALVVLYFGRYMYLELRFRKIKMLEQIALIRKKFREQFLEISDNFVLISDIEKCPPYLRIGSSEWHTINFMSCCFAVSCIATIYFAFCLYQHKICMPSVQGFIIFGLLFILFLFISLSASWRASAYYDAKREVDYGKINQYDLLMHHGKILGICLRCFMWIHEKISAKYLMKYKDYLLLKVTKKTDNPSCIFCKEISSGEFIIDTKYFIIRKDKHPVSEGHLLVIPKRHVALLTQLTSKETKELGYCLQIARQESLKIKEADGFNMGINEGKAAGQTIEHIHIHIIPRRKGDVSNPTGGIRNVIPSKGEYPQDSK